MDSSFALCHEGRLSSELRLAGAAVYPLGAARLSRPWSVWRARRALARLLRRERFDAAVCHMAWTQAVFGPAVREAGLPLVFWLHSAADEAQWLDRWARRTPPDLGICNSRFVAESFPVLYPGVRRETVLYPVELRGIAEPEDHRSPVRRSLGTPEDACVILQVSRMEHRKGQGLLLEALGRLHADRSWLCWIVGGVQRPEERAYFEGLKDFAKSLGIAQRVRFTGERTDIPRLMAAADIFCQPNTEPEPFGISFVEALFAGLPVAAVATGGAAEIVDDACGVLVPPRDPEALSRALGRLIAEPALRRRLGQAGPARARLLCDAPRQLRLLRDLFYNLIDGEARRKP